MIHRFRFINNNLKLVNLWLSIQLIMKNPSKSFTIAFVLISFLGLNCYSQSKKSIDHTVYDTWKEIVRPLISNDGSFVAYEINPQKGDGVLTLFNSRNEQKKLFNRGSKAVFGANSNFLVFTIKPQFDTVRAKKLKKVKKDKLPKDSVGIYVFESGEIVKYPKLVEFKVAEETADWIGVLIENVAVPKDESDTTDTKKSEAKTEGCKSKGKTLILSNPISGDSVSFSDVCKFTISKNGDAFAFIQARKDSVDSVFVSIFDTRKLETSLLFENEGFSENITLDEKGEQLAFTFSQDSTKVKPFDLIYIDLKNEGRKSVLNDEFKKQNADLVVSQHGKIMFNEKGDELYFGTINKPEPELKDTLTDDEKVSLDIWNWKDSYLQSQQLKQLKKEQERSYTTVYFPDEDKTIQLASEEIENVRVNLKATEKYSIGTSNKPYRKMVSWDASRYYDIYLLDRETGEHNLILKQVASTVSLSPEQNFVAWYNIVDSTWNSLDLATRENRILTSGVNVNFYNELNDIPNEAGSYGFAGWTKKEKLVIYDRFDLWMFDPSGKETPKNITNGFGRKNDLKFRYVKLDKEEQFLPEEMKLSAFNEITKQAGYFNLNLKNGDLSELVLDDFYYKNLMKAKDADKLIWRKETFVDFPDLYFSDLSFENIKKLSTANPQQSEYNWGTTELVDWVSFNGDSLQGILVKPENFDPTKKYPMLVYFYERSSDRLNRYYVPKPIRSVINWTYYASNGYLIFIPDIVYRTGYPGPSAFDCIVSGVQTMCDRFSFIDRENLGIQGQSWGGYQTAYIITQTDMFKAAMAGAPVSNMTSAYGGIRWGSGLSRAFQYEESQSRIGATLWERRDLYILNSPLFFADQVNTPLLMMHNDEDGAVPWYQGIEYFNALRRLNKPVWMLVYNGAPHNLKRRADMKDLTKRMQQFFDFYLKGSPEPVWMELGIPAIEKGKTFGFEFD